MLSVSRLSIQKGLMAYRYQIERPAPDAVDCGSVLSDRASRWTRIRAVESKRIEHFIRGVERDRSDLKVADYEQDCDLKCLKDCAYL